MNDKFTYEEDLLNIINEIKTAPARQDKKIARAYFDYYFDLLKEAFKRYDQDEAEQLSKVLEGIMEALPEKYGRLNEHLLLNDLDRDITQLMDEAQNRGWDEVWIHLRNVLLLSNQAFLTRYANQYLDKIPDYDDLIGAANVILIEKSFDKFDASKGNKFLTYAYHWVRKGLNIYRSKFSHPISMSTAEITKLGRGDEDAISISHVPLERPDEEGNTLIETIPSDRDVEQELEAEYHKKRCLEILSQMPQAVIDFIEEELDEIPVIDYEKQRQNTELAMDIYPDVVVFIEKLKEKAKGYLDSKYRQAKVKRINSIEQQKLKLQEEERNKH